ncbi:MAG: transcription termination/antitermination protein NusA [Acidobacteria bacterium]|nr:MAG: transcription termination/antitermination protein NusA [Acidobacteriota bacterium]
MSNLLFQTIDQISREKGIDPKIVVHAIEDAIVVASRKYFKSNEELRGRINSETGEIDVFAVKKVVDNVTNPVKEISLDEARAIRPDVQMEEEIEFQKPTAVLGRIAAQMAKQVIFQKVREAERESVYAEYHKHVGEVVNCVVKRFENGDIIVELGKTEGKLPKREQSKLESFSVTDRIRVVIIKVEKTSKGPQVIVSRTDPTLVQHLFQTEVPEIYDGTVQIKSTAREAGERTKIAVASREKDVDPVGACVGMKGTRVQSIIRELRGEKIDIIQWSDDVVTFATNAISPAKISRVSVVESNEKIMEMVVEDSQLSLAIGKKGQNVRLASKLIGWRIDIKSEEEKRAEVESQMEQMQESAPTPLENMPGLSPSLVQKLNASGIATVEQLADLSPEDLENIPGVGEKTIEKISDALSEYYTQSPAYQDEIERLTQQHMFSKDKPEPDARKADAEQGAKESKETSEESVPEE